MVLRQDGNAPGAEVRTEGGPWVPLTPEDIDILIASLQTLRDM